MPRKKKPRRPNARKYKSYNKESMQRAIDDVKNGRGSVKMIAQRYAINRTTLMNHVKNYKSKSVGRPTILTRQEEELLVHALIWLGEWGYGFDRIQLQLCVQDFVQRMDRPNPFKNGLPGVDWCTMFENRWKAEISRRVAQNLPKNRAMAGSQEVMEDFYNKLDNLLNKYDLRNKPQNIFNCDETGFQTDAGIQKVLCKRGSRNPNKLVGSTKKSSYTVLMCCNAIGDYLPMFVNYKGLHLYTTWCNGGPEATRYNCSPSGWMEGAQFHDWFENTFIPETSHLEGTKLLILDGHNSHLSLALIDKAVENKIELFCLPAHTSHLLQPLDVGVYKAVKQSWRKILQEFYQNSGYKNVDKLVFPSLMKKLSQANCFSRANAIGGFEGAGIYLPSKEKMMKKVEVAAALSSSSSLGSSVNVPPNITPPASPLTLNETPEPENPTPKKSLELALLSALKKNNNNKGERDKRSKVTRKFAESLTDSQVRERMRLQEEEKKGKQEAAKAKKEAKKQKQRKRVVIQETSSSESDVNMELESEDGGDESFERSQPLENLNLENSVEIANGAWLLVQYTNVCYIGKVISANDNNGNLEVTFLRRRNMHFAYPDVEDTQEISPETVIKILQEPLIQRGKHYFDIKAFPSGVIIY